MDAGTVATDVALLESDTVSPPAGANPLSKAVPVDWKPPPTDVGASESPAKAEGVTERVCFFVVAPKLADIVALAEVETPDVVIVKVAEVWPAGTIAVE
jgi:hypothetical protein